MFRQIPIVALVVLATFGSARIATADGSKNLPKELADLGTDDAKADLETMQGSWTFIAAERDGEKVPDEKLKAMQFVIKGDSVIVNDGGREEKAALKLDPSAKPKAFDIMPDGRNEPKSVLGIYELTAGTLKMCWRMGSGERPREFASKQGSGTAMFLLKRDKK